MNYDGCRNPNAFEVQRKNIEGILKQVSHVAITVPYVVCSGHTKLI